jgi:PAS domain-containing protein
MNHNSVSFPNPSPGDPASASAYSDPANEYVSGTNDAAAQALMTNSRNPRSEIGTGLLDWMGRVFGDAVERANYPLERLLQALPAAIYATDAVGRITFYNDAAAKLWGCRPELGNSEFGAHHSRWSRPSVVGLEQGRHDCDGGPRACHQRRQTWCSVEW